MNKGLVAGDDYVNVVKSFDADELAVRTCVFVWRAQHPRGKRGEGYSGSAGSRRIHDAVVARGDEAYFAPVQSLLAPLAGAYLPFPPWPSPDRLCPRSRRRARIRRSWRVFTVTPACQFALFWFRFGGFASALNEQPSWCTRLPWEETREASAALERPTIASLRAMDER